MNNVREKLAELAHEQWSGWIKYMFSKGKITTEGTLIIPQWAYDRWMRQANSAYSDLSEHEKNSDREEADKFLAILKEPK